MATYTVVLERDYILRERAEFEVEAESEAEAKAAAYLEAETDEDADWNEIDGSPGDDYTVVSIHKDEADADEVIDTGKPA